ncbi:cyclic nucleotide-binding/CBS domain-containing protein [Bowmanella yangjiangensis]|uniref:CBS domain-containing protein n=1 Tax=Bowmanella yangjiangensis TaxID=2811230 RepID=A0ABS3CWY2_9ALTE|nr:CBS domain-containing protein [Bowmanella yangjiangensis]MBN7821613.1 CBS domain-containing protein [Bowmanella yangjiangensis]
MRVGDLPLHAVIRYVKASDSLETARQQMLNAKISSLLVVDTSAAPVGLITSRDLLKVNGSGNIAVEQLTTQPLVTISEDAEIRQACRLMLDHQLHHLAVVGDDEVVGILSSLDIVAHYLSL